MLLSPEKSHPTFIAHKLPLCNKRYLGAPEVRHIFHRDSVLVYVWLHLDQQVYSSKTQGAHFKALWSVCLRFSSLVYIALSTPEVYCRACGSTRKNCWRARFELWLDFARLTPLDPWLPVWLPWVPASKVISDGRSKAVEAQGPIQADFWPWLIPWITLSGSNCLRAVIWDYLVSMHPTQSCWWCIDGHTFLFIRSG